MKRAMKHPPADAQLVPYPKFRRWMAAAYRTVRHKTFIHALLEVDVTGARAALRAHKARTGESLSFTAFLIACLAKAVDEHKEVQALRQGRKQLILFEDVDVFTLVEHDIAGQKYIMPHVIRAANRKSVHELHHEIRAAQEADMADLLRRFRLLRLPTALFRSVVSAYARIGTWRPRLWKRISGTVGVTSVGMFGEGAGWGIPSATPTTLMLTVGGIGNKQLLLDGHATVREYLSLTVSVDHDLVDGAPAARFTHRLKDLIEGGYGLAGTTAASEPEQATAAGASEPEQQKVDAARA